MIMLFPSNEVNTTEIRFTFQVAVTGMAVRELSCASSIEFTRATFIRLKVLALNRISSSKDINFKRDFRVICLSASRS
jgi:hypothetical protein